MGITLPRAESDEAVPLRSSHIVIQNQRIIRPEIGYLAEHNGHARIDVKRQTDLPLKAVCHSGYNDSTTLWT